MALVAVLGGVIGVVWLAVLGMTDAIWTDWVVHNGLIAVGSGVIAWTVAPGQPRNIEIWVFAWAGLFTGLLCLLYSIGAHLAGLGSAQSALEVVPAELTLGVAVIFMFVNFLWVGVLLPFTLGIVLFPDGRPPSSRWRWLVTAGAVIPAVLSLALFWAARPSVAVTLSQTQDTNGGWTGTGAVVSISYLAVFALVPFCLAALVVRFRRSKGLERQQFRWVVWGASVTGLLMVSAVILDEAMDRLDIALGLGLVAMTVLLASFGVAIGRYKLYEIDTVISRTLVYGALALFIGAVYVGIVVGVGRLLGAGDKPNIWLEVLATVVIAIAFQPLRRQLQRVANRIVYGRRATPYEVLSSFARRVSAVDPDVLTQVARSLAEGTTATSASIWVIRDDSPHCIAAWPGATHEEAIGTDGASDQRVAPVTHDGEDLGRVLIRVEPGQPFPVNDARLLAQVAAGLGLALRNLQLTDDLRARVDELASSRRRIVAVQDGTRRKLERDLHDGAQQRLVALKIKLGIGAAMAAKAGIEDVQVMLETIRAETDQTIDSVREFARGIYPPLLEADGLGAALSAQGRKMPIPVTVQSAGLARYPKEMESTVYFCVLEALQNAMKHSEASSVQVVLSERDGELGFDVRDDGVGFDAGAAAGSGLVNMVDRVEAVGGSLVVDSRPGHGTSVTGTLPALELATR
jgi:signal transduction histidine kinase